MRIKVVFRILSALVALVLLSAGAYLAFSTGLSGSGRDMGNLRSDDEQLRKVLSPLQYDVTRNEASEPAFRNEYWNNDRDGIYVDVVSGEPLFSSVDKFHSGSGRPSFTKPLDPDNIVERRERNWFFIERTEVRSRAGDLHLGYLYDDGPPPTGLRYSLNSAALRFVPREDLAREGYGTYSRIFSCKADDTSC